ncbi:MAG: 16S rRNA (uracil(1498)-N(3))-methyltransferase [Clostridia bacterium]|nr:16S rRNA (uracil(1498)-N(3))-methyltransferase [Clostridia bacterium]
MPKFFLSCDSVPADFSPTTISITGNDAFHLSRVLRIKNGEVLQVSDQNRRLFTGSVVSVSDSEVVLSVLSITEDNAEPDVKVTVYQALVKGDKFDTVIQKSVECGACEIVPVICERCIVKIDDTSRQKKVARWQKIADEAAKQCGRGILPNVCEPITFRQAIDRMSYDGFSFVCYEGKNVVPIKELLRSSDSKSISFLIGPEGGLSESEYELASKVTKLCGLGPRILRTETASTVVLSAIMYHTDNL